MGVVIIPDAVYLNECRTLTYLALLQFWDNNNYYYVVYEIENELMTGADIAYLSVRGGPCQLRTGGPRAAWVTKKDWLVAFLSVRVYLYSVHVES